jgi:long-subunit acyl-CoA synthetase (AMP-forming)
MSLGVEPGQGVVVLGNNRPEWFISDLAAIACGAVPAGVYATSTEDQVTYIADHCHATVAILESREYLERFPSLRAKVPSLRAIVLMEGQAEDLSEVYSWDDLVRVGNQTAENLLQERIEAQQPDGLATLIYTSGTTGTPKAVMLSHRNILWTSSVVCDQFQFFPEDRLVSYLPLSHIAEQIISLYSPLHIGCSCWFAESLEKLVENLREVRPHVFFGVPRVWEKMQAGVVAAGAKTKGLKRQIAMWAKKQGLKGGYADQRGEKKSALYGLADRLVFQTVRQRLGLDRARICATSAAPISLHTLEFFLSLGIPILEVYGMTECTGPTTFSTPEKYRSGKAGFAMPGSEVRIAEDGEILMRGKHVFLGYYRDESATASTLDPDGWLHSGDIGNLDDNGFLSVTDRKKDLIITSGGKNVAPQPIEAQLKQIPAVASASVIGDRKNYLVALLTLDPDTVASVAETAGSEARDTHSAASSKNFRAFIETHVARVNEQLASYQTIKKFTILPEPFSVEGGELTPTLKMRRKIISSKYQAEIDALYA